MDLSKISPLFALAGLGIGYVVFTKIDQRMPATQQVFGVPKRTIVSAGAGGALVYVGSGMEGIPKYLLLGVGGGVLLGEGLKWAGGGTSA
jgi:hypothetical protein